MKGSGWHEGKRQITTPQGIKSKAPEHYRVSVKKGLEGTLRVPMVKREPKWTEQTIIAELKTIIAKTGRFPTLEELKTLGRQDLTNAIFRHNVSINYFRKKLGYEPTRKQVGYWTERKIITKLKKITLNIGHFPTSTELITIKQKQSGLRNAISKHGGINYFREKLGYKTLQKSVGYWTEETVLKELKQILLEIHHFPTRTELEILNRYDLLNAISRYGGSINYFREKLRYKPLKVNSGYWTEETVLKELKQILLEIHHFPTRTELEILNRYDLLNAIFKCGEIDYFRRKLGYKPSLEEFMGSSAYNARKGYKSETEVKKLLLNYCNQRNIVEPVYYKKLSIGNVIEFLCGGRVGIDVTNARTERSIRRKYLKKNYHKYLDKLWIVVLSNAFTNEDYLRFNEESPKNVEIMSVWDLIDRLQIDIDEHSRRKIEALEVCTLRTKDDLINDLKNRSLGEYT